MYFICYFNNLQFTLLLKIYHYALYLLFMLYHLSFIYTIQSLVILFIIQNSKEYQLYHLAQCYIYCICNNGNLSRLLKNIFFISKLNYLVKKKYHLKKIFFIQMFTIANPVKSTSWFRLWSDWKWDNAIDLLRRGKGVSKKNHCNSYSLAFQDLVHK